MANDNASGIVGVELGDSSLRAIKAMKIDYNSDQDKVEFTTNPTKVYQVKA